MPASQPSVFALLVGVDNYKSPQTWNLTSAVSDVSSVRHYLTHHLHVPRTHIRTLLDSTATTAGVERAFKEHLIFNDEIVKGRGDAIIIYWAGHGTIVGLDGTPVLVTYDHDTKSPSGGRIAGISERKMSSLVRELSDAKGNNITVVLDSSFSSPSNARERGSVRWTATSSKTSLPDEEHDEGEAFFHAEKATHTLIAAAGPGESAVETNSGGRFTQALLASLADPSLLLHKTSYLDLISHIRTTAFSHKPHRSSSLDSPQRNTRAQTLTHAQPTHQTPLTLGLHKHLPIFFSVPFPANSEYISLSPLYHSTTRFRIEAGSNHGLNIGSELSIHAHNRQGSSNSALDTIRLVEVHPEWSVGVAKTGSVSAQWAHLKTHPLRMRKDGFTPKAREYLKRRLPFGLGKRPAGMGRCSA